MADFVSDIYVFFATLHFIEMGQLVYHLLQEWIGINRLNSSLFEKISCEEILSGIWKDTLFPT